MDDDFDVIAEHFECSWIDMVCAVLILGFYGVLGYTFLKVLFL